MQFFKVKQSGQENIVNRVWQKYLYTKFVDKGAVARMKLSKVIGLVGVGFLCMGNIAYGTDLGTVATTFAIQEQSFSVMIQKKLAAISDIEMQEHQRKIIKTMQEKVNRPTGVSLPRAVNYRRFVFNPAITTTQDIVHAGKVLIPKGTTVNPHDFVSLSQALVFLNGDDVDSLAWASSQDGILILTHGAPLQLARKLDRQVYFDQMGKIVQRFGIEALPARVSQVGKELIVEEVVV